VTKTVLKKREEKLKRLEELLKDNKQDAQTRINRLKRMGVFIRSYNMAHLLATRYNNLILDIELKKTSKFQVVLQD
jgi:Ribosomal L27e protein family